MVEGARLESVYAGNRIAGSNPALSAMTYELITEEARCKPVGSHRALTCHRGTG